MQNTTPNGQPVQPSSEMQQMYAYAPAQPVPGAAQQPPAQGHPHHGKPKPKRRGFFGRFVRGYLMLVGALVNIFVLIQLIIELLIFVGDRFSLV